MPLQSLVNVFAYVGCVCRYPRGQADRQSRAGLERHCPSHRPARTGAYPTLPTCNATPDSNAGRSNTPCLISKPKAGAQDGAAARKVRAATYQLLAAHVEIKKGAPLHPSTKPKMHFLHLWRILKVHHLHIKVHHLHQIRV